MYLCNDQDVDITVDLKSVANYGSEVDSYCASIPSSDGDLDGNYSGQLFVSDDGGYNVVVAFCDNNEPTDTLPSSYSAPGPNGSPLLTCGIPGTSFCALGACDTSTIVVETAESVTCNEFLGNAYTTPGNDLTYTTTRTISYTWSVGGTFGINLGSLSGPLGTAGFEFSFAETVATG